MRAILTIFAERYPEPLKQFDVRTAKVAPAKSIQRWLPKLVRRGFLEPEIVRKSAKGNVVKYRLTVRGRIYAAEYNPRLYETLPARLREESREGRFRRKREREKTVELLTSVIRGTILSGKARPNFEFTLRIVADKNGEVRWGFSSGTRKPPRLKGYLWRTLSDNEVEKLIAAGGGKLDKRKLTPQQKALLESFP